MADYIDALYRELLGRPAGEADMAAGRWAGHPESTVRTGILNSAEYNARNAPSSSSSMSGFMHGFGMPSSSSSALDGILKQMYEFQLSQGQFHFDQYKENQLPYEQDFWKIATEQLPDISYHNKVTSEAMAHLQGVQAEMGNITLQEMSDLAPHRFISSEAKAHLDNLAASMGNLKLDEAIRLHDPSVNFALEGIESARGLLPWETEASRTNFGLRTGMNEMGLELLPWQKDATQSGLQFQTDMNQMGSRLLPFQEAASQSGLQLQNEQNAAGRYLLPQETQLTAMDIQRQQALMPDRQYAAHKFFQDANHGVNPEEWAARAGVDVGAAYAGADAALRRDAARMGVDPSSGRFASAQGGYGLNMARDLAQARTQGRRAGEDENWQRRVMAANYAK